MTDDRTGGVRGWFRGGALDRWAILLVFLVHAGFFPYFPEMHSANELSRLYLVYGLVNRGEVDINASVRQYGDINDKSQVLDDLYSDKPPGTAFLAAPFVALRQAVDGGPDPRADLHVARFVAGILPTLALLLMLRREMVELGVSAASRALALSTYGLGTLGFTYSVVFYGHQLTAVLLFAVFFLVRRRPLTPALAAGAGFLGASCLAVEYQSAVYLLPLAIVTLVRAWPPRDRQASAPRGSGGSAWAAFARAVGAAFLGTIPPLVALALYHDAAFGSPLRTGYSFVANPFFAGVHAQGFMGISKPRLEPFGGSLFGLSKGLLAWSPFLVLGFAGLVAYGRALARPRTGAALLRVVQVFLPVLFVSSMVYWDGGWTVSQRHLTPLVPFLVAPAACLLDRSRVARLLAPALAVASVGMTGLATVVYPHLPENLANPFHDLTLPLLAGGCLAPFQLGIEVPPLAAAGIAGAAFAVLVLATVAWWPDGMRARVAATILMVLLPLAWYDGSSRIQRLGPDKAKAERMYFENQCRAAGRWHPDPPVDLLRRPPPALPARPPR